MPAHCELQALGLQQLRPMIDDVTRLIGTGHPEEARTW
ncbi:MAG: hypothetical protein HLUCCO15_05890 [Erythrobacteraceae bacterium HL-111]|nr:MAG: hypothetical protein HLUCCO15_05890 [Erythrobacteraceae bacterium HL-111]